MDERKKAANYAGATAAGSVAAAPAAVAAANIMADAAPASIIFPIRLCTSLSEYFLDGAAEGKRAAHAMHKYMMGE